MKAPILASVFFIAEQTLRLIPGSCLPQSLADEPARIGSACVGVVHLLSHLEP